MIRLIAYKELVTALRDKRVILLAFLVCVLMIAASYNGYTTYLAVSKERIAAQEEKRQDWLHQDPKHPHIAAHFGTFAFRQKSIFSFIDFGVDNFTGSFTYLEPHKQNDFSFKPSGEYNGAIRFGELSVAMVLQLLLPLLIIFLGFTSFTREKETGTLKILLTQNVSLQQVAIGKVIGLYGVIAMVLVPALAITGYYLFSHTGSRPGNDMALRTLLLLLSYGVYLFVFTAITVFVSAISRSPGNALLVMLSFWIVSCIIIPKTAANIGDDLYRLPSQYVFADSIHTDITNGIDGHNPRDERAKRMEQELLVKYHVDTVSELPFNFEGYIMQKGEEYSSQVYDKYFHRLQYTLSRQNNISRLTSIIDPYMAMQDISMGLSATDLYTHIDFQRQSENYRRQFVQQMNENMRDHSRLGDWDYKAAASVYAGVPDFYYIPLSIRAIFGNYALQLIALLCWLFVLLLAFYFFIPTISIV